MFVIIWGLCENEAKHWKNNYTGGVFEIQGVHENKNELPEVTGNGGYNDIKKYKL